jgi:hypothetical protein
MLGKRMKQGLTALGLGTMLVLGAGSWGMVSAAPRDQRYTGQAESIHIDYCDQQPGTCSGSLVLAQAGDREVTLTIPAGATVQRGDEHVHLEQLGVGNYVTVQAPPPSDQQGHGRDWTWGKIDAYERSPINSGAQGAGGGNF